MTNPLPAAKAVNTNPLSDEYVNAVIQQHGYDSPECVIARLHQWIGLHGAENGVTLLMYEAHKALSKLRAPVADERAAFDKWFLEHPLNQSHHSDTTQIDAAFLPFQAWQARAALASAPVAGEAQPVAYRAWFDQDNGARWLFTLWPEEERLDVQWEPLYAAPQACEAVRWAGVDLGEDGIAQVRNAALEEAATFLERNRTTWLSVRAAYEIRALKSQSAALSAQPGAQKKGGSDA